MDFILPGTGYCAQSQSKNTVLAGMFSIQLESNVLGGGVYHQYLYNVIDITQKQKLTVIFSAEYNH